MSSAFSSPLRALLLRRSRAQCSCLLNTSRYRFQSTTASPAKLLNSLRDDLKTAMRAKDQVRLNVLRALLAEITNASKTSSPITTDVQLLSLLRKRAEAAKEAALGFANAGRSDLKEKEDAQISILEGYSGQVDILSEDQIREKVGRVLEEMEEDAESSNARLKKGDVMRRLLGPGGSLEGAAVDKKVVGNLGDDALGPR